MIFDHTKSSKPIPKALTEHNTDMERVSGHFPFHQRVIRG